MNQYVIEKEGLSRIIEFTVGKNKDIRLFHKLYFKRLSNRPIRFYYSAHNTICLKVQLEVRFGIDVLKSIDKMSMEIKTSLDKMAKVTVKTIELIVKGVFDEKEIKKSNKNS
jgi:uncharacterized alkaline shock family protein YloU